MGLSEAYLGLRDFKKARYHLDVLADLPNTPAKADALLGEAHWGLGEQSEARLAWQRALRKSPNMIAPKKALFEAGF